MFLHYKDEPSNALISVQCKNRMKSINRDLAKSCVFSGFRRRVDEICALLGYYAALSDSSVSTLRDNLSVPSLGFKKFRKKSWTY